MAAAVSAIQALRLLAGKALDAGVDQALRVEDQDLRRCLGTLVPHLDPDTRKQLKRLGIKPPEHVSTVHPFDAEDQSDGPGHAHRSKYFEGRGDLRLRARAGDAGSDSDSDAGDTLGDRAAELVAEFLAERDCRGADEQQQAELLSRAMGDDLEVGPAHLQHLYLSTCTGHASPYHSNTVGCASPCCDTACIATQWPTAGNVGLAVGNDACPGPAFVPVQVLNKEIVFEEFVETEDGQVQRRYGPAEPGSQQRGGLNAATAAQRSRAKQTTGSVLRAVMTARRGGAAGPRRPNGPLRGGPVLDKPASFEVGLPI